MSSIFFRFSAYSCKYYLVLSELNEYKRVDIAIDAFNKLNKPLYIIGDGPLINKFKNMSNTNITFLSNIDDRQKSIYLSKSKALVFPGIEDFGKLYRLTRFLDIFQGGLLLEQKRVN